MIKEIIDKFCAYYSPGADILYIGDTGGKFPLWNREVFAELGLSLDEHGKMPDVVAYCKSRNWLLLIEAVTSHGPVNPKRHRELKELFRNARAGIVYVTAFLDRATLTKYLTDIAWETEVWVAEAPTHLIHFDGVRFLGPYCAEDKPSSTGPQ